jgi:hypothetical protein
LAKDAKIDKQKISSLQIRHSDIKNIIGVTFEKVSSIEEVKKVGE